MNITDAQVKKMVLEDFISSKTKMLIAIDILKYCIHFQAHCVRAKRNRITTISAVQDQENSAKPLQKDIVEQCYDNRCANISRPVDMTKSNLSTKTCRKHYRMEWMQYT